MKKKCLGGRILVNFYGYTAFKMPRNYFILSVKPDLEEAFVTISLAEFAKSLTLIPIHKGYKEEKGERKKNKTSISPLP